MESHTEVIARMGGQTKLAHALGVDPALLTHWKRRGIPAKYWFKIEQTERAKEHGITAALLHSLPVRTAA